MNDIDLHRILILTFIGSWPICLKHTSIDKHYTEYWNPSIDKFDSIG